MKKSDFRFDKYIVRHAEIDIKSNELNSDSLSLEIKPKGVHDKSSFLLTLEIAVKDKEGLFNVNATIDGYFAFRETLSHEELGRYFLLNAPAIIFPYIRGYISMITSLSGIGNIILPTLNLEGLADELSNNIKQKE